MKYLKKRDIFIILIVFAVALTGAVYIWTRPFEGDLVAAIYIDGELIDQYPLNDGYYSELPIETAYGSNTIIISQGMVWVEDADCADKLCIKEGAASRPGDVIVCAPHRLVVKVEAVDQ